MTRRRKLRPEEQELWSQVARSAVPIRPDRPVVDTPPLERADTKPAATSLPKRTPIQSFEIGSKPAATRIPAPSTPAPRMDAKTMQRMNRGKLKPEGRIDLHGMTVDQAHPELINFILRSHAKGRRLVLVITGKGVGPGPTGPIPYQRGILKRQVPHWLQQMPVAPLILQVTSASPRHGGEGALYVYLGRRR